MLNGDSFKHKTTGRNILKGATDFLVFYQIAETLDVVAKHERRLSGII